MLAVGLATTLFRGAYQQVGNTVAIWLETGVDRGLGGLTIPMTWFQALNPLFVFALTPLLLAWWRRRAEKRSEEHTSELQSLMRNSYAVFCLKKKKISIIQTNHKK